jgi:type III protein arginine methyltransferase
MALLKEFPDDPNVLNILGAVNFKLGHYEEAIAEYEKALALKIDYPEVYSNITNALNELGDYHKAIKNCHKTIILKPDFAEAYGNLAISQESLCLHEEIMGGLVKAIQLKPNYTQAHINLNALMIKMLPNWHLPMMNDKRRNEAYSKALNLAITDETSILEIGTGLGLLSMIAADLTRKDIFTCESSSLIAQTAQKIIDKNGYSGQIKIINKKSDMVKVGDDLPGKVDLIISEILSGDFVGEGVIETIRDAKKRLLKRTGRMIPQSGKIMLSLLKSPDKILNQTQVNLVSAYDLSIFNDIAPDKSVVSFLKKPLLLSEPKVAFTFDLYNCENHLSDEKLLNLEVSRTGTCIGLVQSIKVNLYQDIEYENNPSIEKSHWPTPIYLFENPIDVIKGDHLNIKASLIDRNICFYLTRETI